MSNEEQECQSELLAEQWGARLTSARESLSISLEQAAADLNLPVDYLRCIEAGRADGLPSMVFAKGYIRSYLKLLGIEDIDERVKEFVQIHGGSSSKSAIRPVSRVRQQVKMGDPLMKVFTWAFVLGILGVSVWWWQTQYGGGLDLTSAIEIENSSEVASATQTSETIVLEDGTAALILPTLDDGPVEDAAANKAEENSTESPQTVVEESEPQYLSTGEIAKLQQAIESNPVASDVAESNQPSASNAEIAVSADFVAECWVSIKDGDGKKLFNNLRGKGQSINVEGKPPLSILIGAADAVGSFRYNGQSFDLTPYSRKNVVRLNLPVSE